MRALVPENLEQACNMLNRQQPGEMVKPIAGGTDIMVNWPNNIINLDHNLTLIDLSGLTKDLKYIKWLDNENHTPCLAIGALTTFWDVIQNPQISKTFPLLPQAAKQVGAVQIQTRGTWAGNIINASPAADGVTALLAYDATIILQSTAGTEQIPLASFYLDYKKIRCQPNQLVKEIQIPVNDYDFEYYEKIGTRKAMAISKLGLAVTRLKNNQKWRIAVCSMAPYVKRCPTIEDMLNSKIPVSKPQDFLPAIDTDLKPIDDLRSTAEYRRIVLSRVLYYRLLKSCNWIS